LSGLPHVARPVLRRRARAERPALTGRARAERRLGWMLCAPAAFVMLAVTAYPIGYSFYLSLLRADLRFPQDHAWVGLDNYITVLTAHVWWRDVAHTLIITVSTVAIELVLGMLLALVMHRTIVGRGLVRTSALVPYGIITVVAAFAWRFAWSPAQGGFVPKVFGWTFDPTATTEPFWNYAIVILTEVWKTTPFIALLLLSGLTLVPEELHDAAKVDGATAWQRFWRITIPLMKPAILVALLFRTLDALRIFDSVYIISAGNNPNLESMSVLDFNELLVQLNLGVGSAISVLIFLIVVLVAFLFVKGFGTSLAQQRGEA
jgi:multiple sugar transport system permease protein